MTNFGSWMTSIFQEIFNLTRPFVNAAFAENSKIITDVVAIAMALRDVAASITAVTRKPNFWVSNQVRHKPGCATTDDGWRLEISDLGSRRIVLSM